MPRSNPTHVTLLELYRRARRWSQADLAAFLGPGFTAGSVSLLETQRLTPSARQQLRLREVFGDQADAMLRPIDLATVSTNEGQPS